MTYVVAFDGSPLSEEALERATALARATEERVVAVSVVPTDDVLAEEYGLLDGDEYDPRAAADRLREAAGDVAPRADFRAETIDAYAGKRQIARAISRIADEEDATVVFVGSENAGRVVQPVSSVGGAVASKGDYDVFIVRSAP